MNQIENPTLRAWSEPYWQGVSLIMQRRDTTGFYLGKPVEMVKILPEYEGINQPATMQLDTHSAQLLMDDLWRCGLRPSEGSGSAGSLKATETHLKDMQTIAFKLLEKQIG